MTRVTTRLGDTSWLATRYEDIRFVLSDQRFGPHLHGGAVGWVGEARAGDSLFQDPPGHTRLRRLVSSAFTARRAEQMRPRVHEIADSLVRGMRDAPRPLDLAASFAYPLPIAVISELLGIPRADQKQFRTWSDTFLAVSDETLGVAAQAWSDLNAYVVRLIADKRSGSGDDLLHALIAVHDEHEDRLGESELLMMAISLLIGGYATTANAIGLGALHLLHNGELAALRDDPSRIDSAVEEVLRQQSGGGEMRRVAKEDVRVGGVRVRAGETVLIPLEAANRDPEQFPDPLTFDIGRAPNPHLSFGHGIHFCLGAALARVELQVAFAVLAAAFPGMRLAVPAEEIGWSVRLLDEGPREVPVTW